jgi:hypothetical protein
MLSQEQIMKAQKLARGQWQRVLIRYGSHTLRGTSCHWLGTYKISIENFARRLNKAGIPARAMRFGYTFYLILGDEWVKLCDRLDKLIAEIDTVRVDQIQDLIRRYPATLRWLSKTKIRSQLRSLLYRCRETLQDIGFWNQRTKEYLMRDDEESAKAEFAYAAERVARLEQEWDNLSRQVAMLFL